ncbi:hypothetical protein OGAPHI_006249 [Ogataea philodendri]|uniref:Uncharacterized protein n=1 Tax=Ogataea philodendri TaxID=1378263 RepID=A0A9P8NY56_9ASCO|nr:uncharacterized protein OGAPHI_006249 [Ogataea philodendri]KAH3662068.1 hypothetical protein OGAPHI_006249 [Ogataea philodendri]
MMLSEFRQLLNSSFSISLAMELLTSLSSSLVILPVIWLDSSVAISLIDTFSLDASNERWLPAPSPVDEIVCVRSKRDDSSVVLLTRAWSMWLVNWAFLFKLELIADHSLSTSSNSDPRVSFSAGSGDVNIVVWDEAPNPNSSKIFMLEVGFLEPADDFGLFDLCVIRSFGSFANENLTCFTDCCSELNFSVSTVTKLT